MVMIHDYTGHDRGELPHKVRRHVTDFGCCILFLLSLAALGMVTQYALLEGSPHDFASLPVKSGELCGWSPAVKDKHLLYFCGGGRGNMSYANAICVNTCSEKACPGYIQGITTEIESHPFMGLMCMPSVTHPASKHLAKQALQMVAENENMRHLFQAKGVIDAWPLLLAAALSSIIFGYMFLHCLETFTGCLLKLCFFIIIVLMGAFGSYMVYAGNSMDGADHLPGTGDRKYDVLVGYSTLGAAVALVCIACCLYSSIDRATQCIEAAAECIAETPALLFEPFVSLAIRGAILGGLIWGLLHLVSLIQKTTATDDGIDVEYKQEMYAMLTFYIFMIVWIMELCSATSTFVVAYVVQCWFLDEKKTTEKDDGEEQHHKRRFVVCKAYITGIMYHLGTLSFGALSIAVLRIWRVVIGWFTSSSTSTGNAVAATSGACCSCFADFFDRILQKLNKFAYMDVAVNSNNFCTAAGHALGILTYNAPAAMTLHGCTRIFEIFGVGAITAAGVVSTWLLATKIPMYGNPESDHYVEDPLALCGVAGIICFFIALPFMLCFATAADTILFCFALEKSRLSSDLDEDTTGLFVKCCPKSSARLVKTKVDDSRHSEKTRSLLKRLGA